MRDPAVRARLSATKRAQPTSPHNKGNNWRHALSAEQVRAVIAERARRRRRGNVGIQIHNRMSCLMRLALKNGKTGRTWLALVPYSLSDLISHLESRFLPGMGWHNVGAWHIDHVRPRASFDISSTAGVAFRECWALSNLQPLWALDNLKKGARLSAAA